VLVHRAQQRKEVKYCYVGDCLCLALFMVCYRRAPCDAIRAWFRALC
jgi:hypothetical protein